jgi:hypothetical protein
VATASSLAGIPNARISVSSATYAGFLTESPFGGWLMVMAPLVMLPLALTFCPIENGVDGWGGHRVRYQF